MNLSRILFKLGSIVRTAEVVSTGNPRKITKYATNRIINRIIWKGLRKLR
jgi:hypothetical protein